MSEPGVNLGGNPSTGSPAESGSVGSAGSPSSSVPESLQKFVDASTGTVDLNKVALSYKEAEAKIHTTAQEKLAADRAYEEMVRRSQGNATPNQPTTPKPISFEDMVKDPTAATQQVVDARLNEAAKPIVQAVLEMSHPEIGVDAQGQYKNPVFMDGLKKFSNTLPANVQNSLRSGDYATANWVLDLYKKVSTGPSAPPSAPLSPKPNQVESASAATSPQGTGKIWTRSEVRNLLTRDPQTYRMQESEIRKAYEEGRVKID